MDQNSEGSPIIGCLRYFDGFSQSGFDPAGRLSAIRLCAVFGARLHPLWEARLFVCLFTSLSADCLLLSQSILCRSWRSSPGAEPRPIVWCGKTGRRFAGQLFFDQKQGFEPGQRQPEQRDILFALFVVVRRDRIGFSGVRVPQFEPFLPRRAISLSKGSSERLAK